MATEEVKEVVETAAEEVVETAAAAVEETVAEAAPVQEAPVQEAPAVAEKVETMDDYKDMLEASFRRINLGDKLTGKVIGVSETEVLVDFDYYAPGVIRLEDASDDPSYSFIGNIEVGQELTANVIARDDGAGRILLSRKEAAQLEAWDRLRELKASGENVNVQISGITRGGAVAMLEGVRGFIPASRLSLGYIEEDAMNDWLNKSIVVRVIEAEEADKRLILSAREYLREQEAENKKAQIKEVPIGLVTEGKVETIKPYGAFVDLGNGLSGLLHVSQISNKRIKTPNAVLKEGQSVKVKVIDNKDGKLSLSMKVLEDIMEAAPAEEEVFDLPETEEIGTSLASLFKNIKL